MEGEKKGWETYGLGDIVDNNSTVCIPIVHWRKRLVSFLASGIPYLEFDGRIFIQGYRLRKKCGTDRRFPVVIELVLIENRNNSQYFVQLNLTIFSQLYMKIESSSDAL